MKFRVRREFELVIRVRDKRVKMTEKWGEIHGKLDLVRVSGEFESVFAFKPDPFTQKQKFV